MSLWPLPPTPMPAMRIFSLAARLTPGASAEILPESLAEYSYPSGPAWRGGGMP